MRNNSTTEPNNKGGRKAHEIRIIPKFKDAPSQHPAQMAKAWAFLLGDDHALDNPPILTRKTDDDTGGER